MSRIFWFRKDLRLQDNEALTQCAEAAVADGDSQVLGCFTYQKNSFENLSGIRQHSLVASIVSLDSTLKNSLNVLEGDGADALAKFATKIEVEYVHATESFDPTGISEQQSVAKALAAIGKTLVLSGSNYAVKPGSVNKPTDGSAYRVYTPFYRAWFDIGWPEPFKLPSRVIWNKASEGKIPKPTKPAQFKVRAGEKFALETFERFKDRALFDYSENRNRADLSGTSKLSHALAHGEIHPRTLLSDLRDTPGHNVFRKEIAWREFYADVLFRNPHTLNDYYVPRFSQMRYDTGKQAEQKLERWKQGTTGFPMVDAGMRQLANEGWMHNRVRMIVASFLVKDLHLEWQVGAEWFENCLSDFDPASNSHGWQWTAGCGTDASPYYRVFNPTLQGYKFDPDGNYVRKYIPELSHLQGAEVHEPWLLVDGLINGYPEPMLDHSKERDESLRRLEEIKEK
jgi:deoxyribodipyrimidine photo-lyase